jgi:deoxyribodipyrimidine photo-lyase
VPATVSIVWFRTDLRLADNPALAAAARQDGSVLPVFIWAPDEEGAAAPGAAARWWLHQSLRSLGADLTRQGSRLVIRRGPALDTLRALVGETGATAIHFNRRYEPTVIARDRAIEAALARDGIELTTHNAALLHEPWEITNKEGKPFQVFTPFWKACRQGSTPQAVVAAPCPLRVPLRWPRSLALTDLGLEPPIDWAAGLRAAWQPGEAGAAARLSSFLESGLARYGDDRDRPDMAGTSRLSPHLQFGEISPRQIWHALDAVVASAGTPGLARGADVFARELGWREFAHHLLYHFPETVSAPLRAEFATFPWSDDPQALRAWRRGQTGYPLIDAGMRELWTTGWMHNRVRMVVASFLVKDLLVPWQAGERWFWDTLVDANLANNVLGWQWTAGCGADAAPYFRVFNPTSQGIKFDPAGTYVRRWVPALAKLPAAWLHAPWRAPAAVLADAAVSLGKTYPAPIVDHAAARERALAAFARRRARSVR